jgi:uncharacterized protein YbjT (DUF2867 family)
MQDLTLVVGGTGKTGRRVAERLQAQDRPLRVGSRSDQTPLDWEDRATREPAIRGTAAAYISYDPDMAVPGARDAIGDLAELAVANGTHRLVLLSGRGKEEAQLAEALQTSGADWTILRCSWFMQNSSEGYLQEPLLVGSVALPVGEVCEPFVDAEDIADVAVRALTEDGHADHLYELTGPRALTFAQATEETARACGRPVSFVSAPMYANVAGEAGVPADVLALLRCLFTEVLDGRNANLADGVQRALGRPPRDFTQYAQQAAASAVWSAS